MKFYTYTKNSESETPDCTVTEKKILGAGFSNIGCEQGVSLFFIESGKVTLTKKEAILVANTLLDYIS